MSKGFGCACLLAATVISAFAQTISVPDNFARLVAQEDTDGDKKITVHDRLTPFVICGTNGAPVETIQGAYPLSILLQMLTRADDARRFELPLNEIHFNEPVVARTHRLIRDFYWDALTRRIDAAHLARVVPDPKANSDADYLYVPAADTNAARYFESLSKAAGASWPLKIVLLPSPDKVTGALVRSLDGAHGLLSLALMTNADGAIRGAPYVVPGGRFNEIYYWDSYFITLGLLQDGRKDLARGMAENLLYEMRFYGKIPNGNRTYYLTRSQPPFLTSIIRAVYDAGGLDKAWLASALRTAMEEYQNVWMSPDRLIHIGRYALSRYYDSGDGPCPEVQPGGYDEQIAPWLARANASNGNADLPLTPFRFLNDYLYCGDFSTLTVDGTTFGEFFKQDRAMRESGHDTTHRFDDRAADFVTVDLNSLLYKYETDFAEVIENEFGGTLPGVDGDLASASFWRQRARQRKEAMMALMWDARRGFFFDYDFVRHARSTYISATGLYPLWAKILDNSDASDRNRAQRMVSYAREKLEQRAGLAASAEESVAAARTHDQRQWDYPYGWAPHQMLAWQGLANYGFNAEAGNLAYRWLYAIAKNAHDYDGVIPEKYNVVTGSHEVFVEYGNVGTKFDYITAEGFGWTDASFEVGMNFLSAAERSDLEALKPPD